MFGDTGEPLQFVQPDKTGRRLMPKVAMPYLMADGSGAAAMVRVHPDKRGRALHLQGREDGTRQVIERLRLARATEPKRVVLCCNVPVPDLPVSRLVRFEALAPDRLEAAFLEAGGVLRLSAKGLSEDAPETFTTEKTAARYLETSYTPRAGNRVLLAAWGVIPLQAEMRLIGQRGARPTRVLIQPCADPRAVVERRFGPVAEFHVIDPEPKKQAKPPDEKPGGAEVFTPDALIWERAILHAKQAQAGKAWRKRRDAALSGPVFRDAGQLATEPELVPMAAPRPLRRLYILPDLSDPDQQIDVLRNAITGEMRRPETFWRIEGASQNCVWQADIYRKNYSDIYQFFPHVYPPELRMEKGCS
jgi:hypothetical protein